MVIHPFLAMTGLEMEKAPQLPERCAWMACHFSPYGLGLSNLPRSLPEGAILMVDDITPIHGHSPELIARQLRDWAETFHCFGVLLDFQRPGYLETEALVQYLSQALPCPVAVSGPYAANLEGPVLLPPIPCHVLPEEAIAPWQGRELWLDISMEAEQVIVTEEGAVFAPLPLPESPQPHFYEERLFCRYQIQESADSLQFTLWRTWEDLESLTQTLNASTILALYQEAKNLPPWGKVAAQRADG